MAVIITPSQQRFGLRVILGFLAFYILRSLLFPSSKSSSSSKNSLAGMREIQSHGVLERVLLTDKYLDVHKYPFLQNRQGRDDRSDLFDLEVNDGVTDFWNRFQKPFITGADTAHLDQQVVRGAIDDLYSFHGWVAAACPTLKRPFGQNSMDDHYEDLAAKGHLYYIAIVVHSADHFLVDQLAVIVQLAKRLGPRNIFVSMLDQASTDSTPTLSDLCEAVMITLGIAFRIKRIPPMTSDPSASYYPLEESQARNFALEPLHELAYKRSVRFHKVIWLKGFTCPNDVLESLRVSESNDAAMVCGMDWAEHNGFFIFSDRWRTRDIEGNLFRQAKSNSKPEAGPPRDKIGTERYAAHLPFQTFCCESGTHVVDPEQSYYRGIEYRASHQAHNLSSSEHPPEWDADTQCMDSTQMWFCRDLWTDAARGGLKGGNKGGNGKDRISQRGMDAGSKYTKRDEIPDFEARVPAPDTKPLFKRNEIPDETPAQAAADEISIAEEASKEPIVGGVPQPAGVAQPGDVKAGDIGFGKRQPVKEDDTDANAGTNIDAMSEAEEDAADIAPLHPQDNLPASAFLIPNSAFTPARILVNPRCVTTYGGVSHTQLALDLFGTGESDISPPTRGGVGFDSNTMSGGGGRKYVLQDWAGPPDSFVCQEMRTSGGRTAPKSQRRVGWLLQNEVGI